LTRKGKEKNGKKTKKIIRKGGKNTAEKKSKSSKECRK